MPTERKIAEHSRVSFPPDLSGLTPQERNSVTHGDFWIPETERELYKRALTSLNQSGVPYVVAGGYAIYEHTGVHRETRDLDIFVEPHDVVPAMTALKAAGFRARLDQPHWLAKALDGELFVDVIFGMGNGVAMIDGDWHLHSRSAILAATPVRVAPVEELIWHRLFISERHRQDMADIVHLIACFGRRLEWRRLVDKTGDHWPVLLAQLQMYHYVYPELRGVPDWVMDDLLERARVDLRRPRTGQRVTRGPFISKFSFMIDVHEWGFRDLRAEGVAAAERHPAVRALLHSDVWDERSSSAEMQMDHDS